MRVLVTGISGLLGTNLVFLLLEKGYQVTGLARSIKNLPFGSHPNLELVQTELTADLQPYLNHVDCVVHVAAITRQDLIDYDDYYQVNYKATTHIVESAITAGVQKFIYVSSANTIGYGIDPQIDTPENQPMRVPFTRSLYAKSKAAAESYLLQQTPRLTVHIVNPTFMIGPYDSKPSSGAIILMSMTRRILFYPPGGKNFVAVKDVAAGIEKSITSGKNGKKYLLAGQNLSYRQFFKLVKNYTGKKQCLLPIPTILLQLAGYTGDLLRAFKIKTSLCTNNMDILRVKNYYSNTTSINELEMHYQDIRNAISDSVEYFKSHCPG